MIKSLVILVIAVIFGVAAANAQPRQKRPLVVGIASVIDGDTIEIHGARLRLWGIDAPESGQFCGRERMGQRSANALSEIIGGRTVTCQDRGSAGWGRRVAFCTVAGHDIQQSMVRDGWAYAFSKYSHDYEGVQAATRASNRGVWAAGCQAPWEWRAEHRQKKAKS